MSQEGFESFAIFVALNLTIVLAAGGCGGVGEGEDCVTSTACVTNDDCNSGEHCNTQLDPPSCQKLYCGKTDSHCSEDALCEGQRCAEETHQCACESDCSESECGLDPVCGRLCGVCGDGDVCKDGTCIHCTPDCAGRECGTDPTCNSRDCGDCAFGQGCHNGQCFEFNQMVFIPAGSFWMGCNSAVDDDCSEDDSTDTMDEFPYHEVSLSGYYIDLTEVTLLAYAECISARACTALVGGPAYSAEKAGRPVTYVDWSQAVAFCNWVGKRLPTEAEWEKAARGTDGRRFPWGSEPATCEYAVMYGDGDNGCGTGGTWNICSKSPKGDSPYGLCDMSGNVDEWVSDWYGPYYYGGSPKSDPAGPTSGILKTIRGGLFGFGGGDASLRVSDRQYAQPSYSYFNLGFRCAKDAE